MGRSQKTGAWLESLLFHLLLAIGIGLAGWLANRYALEWDWSDNARNSLSPASRLLLSRLEAPLKITSFAPENPQLRSQIKEIVQRYQRYRPDIELQFVNPARHPALTRELGIQVAGELRLEYLDRSDNLRRIDEQGISNAIQRLIRQGERWIMVLQGHGERKLSGPANHDLGQFGAELERKGYRIQPLDIASHPVIPDNTGLLVIASPQTGYLPGEIELIEGYLARGGNLLWLLDPGDIQVLKALAEKLGLAILPGTIVDANAASLGLKDPAMAVIPRYPDHPATNRFDSITLYPHAAALTASRADDWRITPLLRTLPKTWNETGPIQGEVQRNPDLDEQAGPLTIGVAFTRGDQDRQRVMVIGDGDFLSNTYLGNGGNLDLGLNLIRWLTRDDSLIDIPARTARDLTLALSPSAGAVIGLGLLIGLPLLLAASGGIIWWRRRS